MNKVMYALFCLCMGIYLSPLQGMDSELKVSAGHTKILAAFSQLVSKLGYEPEHTIVPHYTKQRPILQAATREHIIEAATVYVPKDLAGIVADYTRTKKQTVFLLSSSMTTALSINMLIPHIKNEKFHIAQSEVHVEKPAQPIGNLTNLPNYDKLCKKLNVTLEVMANQWTQILPPYDDAQPVIVIRDLLHNGYVRFATENPHEILKHFRTLSARNKRLSLVLIQESIEGRIDKEFDKLIKNMVLTAARNPQERTIRIPFGHRQYRHDDRIDVAITSDRLLKYDTTALHPTLYNQ